MQISDLPLSLRLADVFPVESTVLGLTARTKVGAIGQLLHRLVDIGRIAPDVERPLAELILAREKLGSTALGSGIAIPHCRTTFTDSFVGAIAIDREGVPFDALDKGLVHAIFLLVGPLTHREEHFRVLGQVSSIGKHQALRWQLCGCRSAKEVHSLLSDWDADDQTPLSDSCRSR